MTYEMTDEKRKIIDSGEMCKEYKYYTNGFNRFNRDVSIRSSFNKTFYIKQRKKAILEKLLLFCYLISYSFRSYKFIGT